MKRTVFEKKWRALGTDIYIQVVDDSFQHHEMEKVFSQVKELYEQKENIFSRFDSESELSKINVLLGEFVEASADMLALAKSSLEYFDESGGIFDPRILDALEKIGYGKSFKENDFSGEAEYIDGRIGENLGHDLIIDGSRIKFLRRMDFSGIAKGYITDRVADFLREKSFKNFLVDSGGDMFAQGKNVLGAKWGIALEGSENENEIMLEISDEAVATSGSVRRNWKKGEKKFHHLLDPRNMNDFSFDLKSVTVAEKTVERSDVMAKILFLLGVEKGMELAEEKKMRAIFLKQDGKTIKSKYI